MWLEKLTFLLSFWGKFSIIAPYNSRINIRKISLFFTIVWPQRPAFPLSLGANSVSVLP